MDPLIQEDAPANAVGDGGVAGVGVGAQGEPGVPGPMITRKKFAGHDVFEVPTEWFLKARLGKRKHANYKTYVGEDQIGQDIRAYGNADYARPIIVQDAATGCMQYLRYGTVARRTLKEDIALAETADAGLAAKAEKSGVAIGTLRKVYNRGVAAWNSGHRPGTTPQQWGMARVNSYITKGEGTYHGADKDLHEEDVQQIFGALEEVVKAIDRGEYDFEGQMARTQLQTIYRNSKDLIDMVSDEDNMPEWVQSKITLAQDYLSSVRDYLQSKEELGEAVIKDKESGLPKKYVAGLSATTAKARAAHWDKMDKKSDSDPSAYEPAPGDATAETKPSKHTLKYHAMFGENMDEELYEACWDTHKQVGVKKKGDKMVPNCVPKNEDAKPLDEISEGMAGGLYTSFHKDTGKIAYIGNKSGRDKHIKSNSDHVAGYTGPGKKVGDIFGGYPKNKKAEESVKLMEDVEAQFDLIEEVIEDLALLHNLDSDYIWESLEHCTDQELLEYAVDAKGHKSSTGGLTQKGRDAYNAKGANLKAPVTTPPSKLKAGSKAANRRKSFCARMGGMEGPMKKPNGEPTRKALALRKWNC